MLKLHEGLHQAYSSVLIQIQTGKIALTGYLGIFNTMDSTACPCSRGPQSVQHVLTACQHHATLQSNTLWKHCHATDYRMILHTLALARQSCQYMLQTQLLG